MTVDATADNAGLEERIGSLEAQLAEQTRAARVQIALYRIAAMAAAADDMLSFYRGLHEILKELIDAENMFVALYDEERRVINWPFYSDSVDTEWPDPRAWEPMGEQWGKGSTAYVLRTGHVLHAPEARMKQLIADGELQLIGVLPSDWLGVPLRDGDRTVGVLALQLYEQGREYTAEDEQLLSDAADHIGAALSRTRAGAEVRQRNAELAIVSEVGQALGRQLDFEAITELVGERIHTVFAAHDMFVALYDRDTNLLSWPYEIANGERYHSEPITAEAGLTATVIRTRAPLLVRTEQDMEEFGVINVGPDFSLLAWCPDHRRR